MPCNHVMIIFFLQVTSSLERRGQHAQTERPGRRRRSSPSAPSTWQGVIILILIIFNMARCDYFDLIRDDNKASWPEDDYYDYDMERSPH